MTAPGRQTGSFGDELTNMLMAALIGLFGQTLILRVAGSIAAFLTGAAPPSAGIAVGVGVLTRPGNPGAALGTDGLNAIAYWVVAAVLLLGSAALGAWLWMLWRRHSRKIEMDPRKLAGTATGHDVSTAASSRALLRRAGTLRPSLDAPGAADVGYRIGQSRGRDVWASVEDSILLIGPPAPGRAYTSSSTRSSTRRVLL